MQSIQSKKQSRLTLLQTMSKEQLAMIIAGIYFEGSAIIPRRYACTASPADCINCSECFERWLDGVPEEGKKI